MPDRMPENMPDAMSDRMPEDMPEDLPDRMPEHMPDRMPKDMSDRMPEDLPVRKCINVMVGITRSKVIFLEIWQLFRIWRVIIICSLWKSSFLGYASFSDTHMSDKRRVNGRLRKREEMRVQDNVKKRAQVWKNHTGVHVALTRLKWVPSKLPVEISIDVPIRNGPLSSPGVEYGLIVMIQLAGCLLSVILAHLVQCVQWQVESHAI